MTKEKAIEILKYIKHVGNGESEYYGSSVGRLIDVLDAIGCHIEIVRNEIEPNRDEKLEEFLEARRVRKEGMNEYGH